MTTVLATELCTDVLIIISGGLQICQNTGRKRENQWSLTTEIYFQCSKLVTATDAGMNAVPVVSAGQKLQTSESMVR